MARRIAFTACLLLAAQTAAAQLLQQAPTGPLPAVAPHPINVATPADPLVMQKLELLRERIAQRDQLQREIDQLIVETQTPQQMVIHLELIEIDLTAAKKLGIGPARQDSSPSTLQFSEWTVEDLDALRKQGAAETLVSPKLEVASGQQAVSQIGVANADSEQNGVDSPFTDIRVRADSLGNNQVRIDFRVDRKIPGDPATMKKYPAFKTQQFTVDSGLDLTFGQTQSLSGLITKRTRTRRGALGRVTETVHAETVLLIRAEAVMPRIAGILPAASLTPR